MNIRKSTDYSAMYAELDEILSQNLPQMKEIHAIGKAICKRSEKGAAVMAAEYLQTNYPTAQASLRATCAGCGSFTGLMKMTNHFSNWPVTHGRLLKHRPANPLLHRKTPRSSIKSSLR